MVKKLKLRAAVALLAFVSGSASAATVSADSGTVLISTGGGFERFDGVIEAPAGSLLMVQPGGMAHITYTADCVVYVGPGEVRAVDDEVPCGRPAVASQRDATLLIGGGLVLGGGLGLAIALSGHGSPASP
jgi:hypothetical protein